MIKNYSSNKLKSIAVFCGSNTGSNEKIIKQSYALGVHLAQHDIKLVFGGSKLGLMGQVANGALVHGGLVYGVIPQFLKSKEIVHTQLTNLVTTKDMHERKLKMQEMSDGFIMLPGGFGTLEEFFEILTWAQLGLHQKPIGILNSEGYFDDLLKMIKAMVESGFLKQENLNLIVVSKNESSLLEKMHLFVPPNKPKWITKNQT